MTQTQNMKQIAVAFGERIGADVRPRSLRIRGIRQAQWLFHKHPDDPDVIDCYRLPLPMCAEPWDGIPVGVSPFIANNDDAVYESIRQLENSHRDVFGPDDWDGQ
jgi:hypothetical protein